MVSCFTRRLLHNPLTSKAIRLTDVESQPGKDSHKSAGAKLFHNKTLRPKVREFSHESKLIRLIHFCEDAQEDDKDKEDRKNVHESQQETKPQPMDPAVEWTGRNSELGPRRVSSTFSDGDSEEEQYKSCSHFSHGGVYRQHLQAPIAPSIPPHSSQDTWSSCPGADRTRTGGLSPTAGPGFPISLQQHALVQVQGPPTNQ